MPACGPATGPKAGHRLSRSLLDTRKKFLADTDPGLASLAQLDRRQHIEPYLASMTAAVHSATGQPVTVADPARRVSAVACFLAEIPEWGWPDAPPG